MEFDATWLLLGLPLAFAFGWLASRIDLRQLRIDNRRSPKAYFKGLHYLLNEQQDKAIDAFIEAVQKDPDTSELHFALGSLFRRRGDYDRAVRVHEHLIARGDLSKADRDRARHALALDFIKAGLLDRAEDSLSLLEGTRFEQEARLARLGIYERTRDWQSAKRMATALHGADHGDYSTRIAHYLCEQALTATSSAANSLLEEAIRIAPSSGRARIALAEHLERNASRDAALGLLISLFEFAPSAVSLAAVRMADLALACHRQAEVKPMLEDFYLRTKSLDALEALKQFDTATPTDSAQLWLRHRYIEQLKQEPSLLVAVRLMAIDMNAQSELVRALETVAQPLMRYRCAACGFEASRHFWQCPACQSWDSYSTKRVGEL